MPWISRPERSTSAVMRTSCPTWMESRPTWSTRRICTPDQWLRLDPKTSHLQWLTLEDDKEVVLSAEPESTFWLRVHNMLLGWFVPEKLL